MKLKIVKRFIIMEEDVNDLVGIYQTEDEKLAEFIKQKLEEVPAGDDGVVNVTAHMFHQWEKEYNK